MKGLGKVRTGWVHAWGREERERFEVTQKRIGGNSDVW